VHPDQRLSRPLSGAHCCHAGLPGADPINNYMDYTDDKCRNGFSFGQQSRMQDMYTLYRSAAATAGVLGFLIIPICDAPMQPSPPPQAVTRNSSIGGRVSCQRPPDRAVSVMKEALRYLTVRALASQAAPQRRRRAPRAQTMPRSARLRAWWRRPRRRPCRSPRRSRRPSRWRSRRRRRSPSSFSCRKQRYATASHEDLSVPINHAAVLEYCLGLARPPY